MPPMTVSPVTPLIRLSMALRPVPFWHLTHPLDPDLLHLAKCFFLMDINGGVMKAGRHRQVMGKK